MLYNKEKWTRMAAVISLLGVFLSGCGMSDVVNEEIESKKEETDSEQTIKEEDLAVTREEAANMLQKEEMVTLKELDIEMPGNKEYFEDAEELAQYISYMTFSFYHDDIQAEAFLNTLYQHAHPDYLSYFSKDEKNAIQYLQETKKKYTEHLSSPLKSYVITELQYENKGTVATFYYKTILKNGEEIYTLTTLKKEQNKWKFYDNRPSSPYLAEK